MTGYWAWASEEREERYSKALAFRFRYIFGIGKAGNHRWFSQVYGGKFIRALPVRYVK